MILLTPQDKANPAPRMPPVISEAQRQSHLGWRCTTGAEPSCSSTGSGPPSTGLLPAGLGLPQPAQQDCTCSPLPGPQPEIAGRVLAPRRSAAVPVSHIWASNRVVNAAGTKPFSSNPIITLLFPAIAIPYGRHSACRMSLW